MPVVPNPFPMGDKDACVSFSAAAGLDYVGAADKFGRRRIHLDVAALCQPTIG